jgi:hypothetical protein
MDNPCTRYREGEKALSNKQRAQKVARELTPIVDAYLMAKAYAELQREKVDAIQRRLLDATEYFTDGKWEMSPFRITRPKDDWLMSDADSHEYLSDLRDALTAEGYTIKATPGEPYWSYKCPALTAESLQNDAERALINLAAELLNAGPDLHHRLLCAGLDKLHEFVTLCVKMVVNAPGYKNPLTGRAA